MNLCFQKDFLLAFGSGNPLGLGSWAGEECSVQSVFLAAQRKKPCHGPNVHVTTYNTQSSLYQKEQ